MWHGGSAAGVAWWSRIVVVPRRGSRGAEATVGGDGQGDAVGMVIDAEGVAGVEEASVARAGVAERGDPIIMGLPRSGGQCEIGVNDDGELHVMPVCERSWGRRRVVRTAEEMLDEVESASNGDGPDPVATVDDPLLATITVTQTRARAAERALNEAVMPARDVGRSWQAIGDVLGMTYQRNNRRLHVV